MYQRTSKRKCHCQEFIDHFVQHILCVRGVYACVLRVIVVVVARLLSRMRDTHVSYAFIHACRCAKGHWYSFNLEILGTFTFPLIGCALFARRFSKKKIKREKINKITVCQWCMYVLHVYVLSSHCIRLCYAPIVVALRRIRQWLAFYLLWPSNNLPKFAKHRVQCILILMPDLSVDAVMFPFPRANDL